MALFTPLNYHRYALSASPSLRGASARRQSRLLNHILDCFTPLAMTVLGVILLCVSLPAFAATAIPFTINLSKTVNVTGTPRIAVDVGGVTRYATYASGSGTSALTFTYAMVAGDVDLDGVTLSSPIDLNGGTIIDLAGNDATLTFTPPNTSNVKVNYPSLGMDFVADADGRYTLNGTAYNDLTSFLSAAGGTYTRASVGTYFDSAGVLQTAASDTPRFDYDPVTNAAKGILIEKSGANLLTYSNFSQTTTTGGPTGWNSWNPAYYYQSNSASPDNTNGICIHGALNSNGGGIRKDVSGLTPNATYTISFFARQASTTELTQFQSAHGASTGLTNGATDLPWFISTAIKLDSIPLSGSGSSQSYSQIPIPTAWQRFSRAIVADSAGTARIIFSSDDTSGLKEGALLAIWGAQLEQGSFATSYISTTTAAVTRATDLLSIPTGSWFNGNNGTQFTSQYYTSTFADYSPMIGSAQGNSIGISYQGQYGNSIIGFVDGATRGSTGPLSSSSFNNIGIVNSASQILVSRNGSPPSSDTGKTLASATTLYLSRDFNGSMAGAPKWIKKYKFYPADISSTQLQLLTQ